MEKEMKDEREAIEEPSLLKTFLPTQNASSVFILEKIIYQQPKR